MYLCCCWLLAKFKRHKQVQLGNINYLFIVTSKKRRPVHGWQDGWQATSGKTASLQTLSLLTLKSKLIFLGWNLEAGGNMKCFGLGFWFWWFFNYYAIYIEVFPSLVLWRYSKQSESSLGLSMDWFSTSGMSRGQSSSRLRWQKLHTIPSIEPETSHASFPKCFHAVHTC